MTADELDQQHARAQALARKWERREGASFWLCMLSFGVATAERSLLPAALVAWAAWVLTIVMHTRAIRAEHHWWTRWVTAFYREHAKVMP